MAATSFTEPNVTDLASLGKLICDINQGITYINDAAQCGASSSSNAIQVIPCTRTELGWTLRISGIPSTFAESRCIRGCVFSESFVSVGKQEQLLREARVGLSQACVRIDGATLSQAGSGECSSSGSVVPEKEAAPNNLFSLDEEFEAARLD